MSGAGEALGFQLVGGLKFHGRRSSMRLLGRWRNDLCFFPTMPRGAMPPGPVTALYLVEACAESGKTAVLAGRTATLLEAGVAPNPLPR